jgi:hypothetical protein
MLKESQTLHDVGVIEAEYKAGGKEKVRWAHVLDLIPGKLAWLKSTPGSRYIGRFADYYYYALPRDAAEFN